MNPSLSFITQAVKEDLLSLKEHGYIKQARQLNESLNGSVYFSEKSTPLYFTGNPEADTVFVMLNPGCGKDELRLTKAFLEDTQHALETCITEMISYGSLDSEKKRIDNFDIKQPAFLFEFKDTGIELPDFLKNRDKEIALLAKEKVLTQKLQLELIPYSSREFVDIFDNLEMTLRNIHAFQTHIERALNVISAKKRKYILLGSKQHYHILVALNKLGIKKVELHEPMGFRIDNLKNRVFFNTGSILHNGEWINVGIPYSFPRRDLPNAFDKMREYGRLCFEEMEKRFSRNN
jgi:hypothetical protein